MEPPLTKKWQAVDAGESARGRAGAMRVVAAVRTFGLCCGT